MLWDIILTLIKYLLWARCQAGVSWLGELLRQVGSYQVGEECEGRGGISGGGVMWAKVVVSQRMAYQEMMASLEPKLHDENFGSQQA